MNKEKHGESGANSSWGIKLRGLLPIILMVIILIPVLIYPIIFGFHITNDHARWAEFGSYISGIYTPILSLTTLLVLVSQSRMQSSMNIYQIEQATISKVEAHNTQYLETLCKSLETSLSAPYTTIENLLKSDFLFISNEDIFTFEKSRAGRNLYKTDPKLLDCWVAINAGLNQLDLSEGINYRAALSNEKLRVQSIISLGTCLALDNYSRCMKAIPPNQTSYFSDIDTPETEDDD